MGEMEMSILLLAVVVFGVVGALVRLAKPAKNRQAGRAAPEGGARPLGRGPVVPPPPMWRESFRRPEAMSAYEEEDVTPESAPETAMPVPEAIATVTPTESAPFTHEELRRMVIAKEILERRVPGVPRRRF